MTDNTYVLVLRDWLQDGYTGNDTPLDGYGAEIVREVLDLLTGVTEPRDVPDSVLVRREATRHD